VAVLAILKILLDTPGEDLLLIVCETMKKIDLLWTKLRGGVWQNMGLQV
jgi:hypothetical protein